MPVPAIAIHGSGPPHKIARAIDANFEESALYDRVVTLAFDWDRVVPCTSHKGLRNLYRFLQRNAANISAASRMGMEVGSHALDGVLGALQVRLHQLLQWVLWALVAMLFTMLVAEFVVLAPAAWYGLPTLTFSPMRWMAAAVGWSQVGIGAGVTMVTGLGALRLLLTLSPHPAIVTFRSIVLLLLQPVLVIAIGAFAADSALLWASFGVLGLSSFVVSGLGAVVLLSVTFGALLVLRARWARGSLRGPIKDVLDVFRYLGEPGCRERIQQALDKAIAQARERTGEDQDFVLTGQGMGSVMALDSILHSRAWRNTDRLLLVTMGSPLKRYFLRLYPRTFFPEHMEEVIALIAKRLHQFRWINIYRPWDYMGAELGLKPFNGRDLSTGIGDRRTLGHADYWQDMDARRTFHHGLQRLRPIKPPSVAMNDAVHHIPHPQSPAGRFRIPSLARRPLKATFSLGTFGWMLWWVATGSGVLVWKIEGTSELLERQGVMVDAAATHRRETVENDRGLTYVDHWEFAFTDPNGETKRLHLRRDASDAFLALASHRFDDRALTRRIRTGCAGTGLSAWWPVRDMQSPCTLEQVRLRYYPGSVTLLDLPDFPQQRFGSDPLRGWTEAGVVAAVLSALVLIPVILGVRLFGLILG